MKKESPILFSNPMVIATDNDSKSMTRRIIKNEHILYMLNETKVLPEYAASLDFCPYGQIGDLLYVRENWKLIAWSEDFEATFEYTDGKRAEFDTSQDEDGKAFSWLENQIEKLCNKGIFEPDEENECVSPSGKHHPFSPSIHLPKWASRIWLEITDIKVERLHSISEKDIIAEGVKILITNGKPVFQLGVDNSVLSFLPDGCMSNDAPPLTQYQLLFAHWAELWCKINGRESWDTNPWVWVIKFKKIDKKSI